MVNGTKSVWKITYFAPDASERTFEMEGSDHQPDREMIAQKMMDIEFGYAFGTPDPSPNAILIPSVEKMQLNGYSIGPVTRIGASENGKSISEVPTIT